MLLIGLRAGVKTAHYVIHVFKTFGTAVPVLFY